MARMSTCKKCGAKVKSDERKILNGKTYCINCCEIISSESESYKNLINLIYELASNQFQKPNGIIYKQVKEFKEEYDYTYDGMCYTLWYIDSVLHKPLDFEQYGVAIIQYEYNNAQKWWINQQEVEESANNFKQKKTIKINSFNKIIPKSQLINLEELINKRNRI